MSKAEILGLGAIAGFTIFLGLPFGRMRAADPRLRAALSALATGILIFLLWDVLVHAVQPIEDALNGAVDRKQGWGDFIGLAALGAGGVMLGMMSLVYYERWIGRRRATPLVGPGAAAAEEFERRAWLARLSTGHRLALLIATGIGVHNFGEGLAIGQSAAADETRLALVLIIGFGLHNTTEGFGIVGPMSGDETRPSWRFLGALGLIGGLPTFLGTVVGQAWASDGLAVAFFAVAAGSILFVVQELLAVNRRYAYPILVTWMVLLGVFLGFATDFVLEAAGG